MAFPGTIPWNRGLKGFQAGDRSPTWMGGISKEAYPSSFSYQLKLEIRRRDNFTCQVCSRTETQEIAEIGRCLCVNHIDFLKYNTKERNLITLCVRCNSKVNFNRAYWTRELIKIISAVPVSKKATRLCQLSVFHRKTLEERLWEKVDRSLLGPGGCWIWKASTSKKDGGYGVFWSGKKLESAHVVSFKLSGRIVTQERPLVLHLCNVPLCVNPAHLYDGTYHQNALDRVRSGHDQNANKTHCLRGHELNLANVVPYELKTRNGRKCKLCLNARIRARNKRRSM